MSLPDRLTGLAEDYARSRDIELTGRLGQGKDGSVWHTSRLSAIKIHEQQASYRHELAAYMRLRDLQLTEVAGFNVPSLVDFDDGLLAIEMEVVYPPFIVDFASARLDFDPEFIEDEGNTLEDFVRSRFDEQTDQVMGIYHELIARAGIYLTDLHPQNIKFGRADFSP
jgi:hypothetical protein